jgi:hypothetical protein
MNLSVEKSQEVFKVGVKGNVQELPLTWLRNDPRYQRVLNINRVRKISEAFMPAAVGVLVVSKRPDGYYIIDGQHRYHVLISKNIKTVLCLVYEGLDVEQEAMLFDVYNSFRGAVTALSRFNARLVYNDPEAVAIKAVVESAGLSVASAGATGKRSAGSTKCSIQAVAALERAYKDPGPELLSKTLTMLKEVYGGDPKSLTHRMIMGLAALYKKFHAEIDDRRLFNILSKTAINDLQREGAAWEKTIGWNNGLARIIHAKYNKGLTTNKLPEW